MSSKDSSRQYDLFIDDKSKELYGQPYGLLTLQEQSVVDQYTHDLLYPIWKLVIVDGKDTGYKISNVGNMMGKSGSILKTEISEGYHRINGYTDGKPIKLYIHRCVAEAFIPNPENKPQVNHINGKKTLNWVGNLEWATSKENTNHAVDTGLMNIKGTLHPENVYTEDQIRLVCQLLENPNISNVDISKISGVNRSIVYSIRYGKSWNHVSKLYNIYRPERKVANRKINYHRSFINPKTKFILRELNNGTSKNDIAMMLMADGIVSSRKLAIRSINQVIIKYLRNCNEESSTTIDQL